jgi:hypothetical protein
VVITDPHAIPVRTWALGHLAASRLEAQLAELIGSRDAAGSEVSARVDLSLDPRCPAPAEERAPLHHQ